MYFGIFIQKSNQLKIQINGAMIFSFLFKNFNVGGGWMAQTEFYMYTRRLCIEIGEFSSLIRYRPRSHIDEIRHERRDRAFQQSRIA